MDFFDQIGRNFPLWTAIISFFVAQTIKIIINLTKNQKFTIYQLVSSGGMPSSHSSFVSALTTAIGFKDGFDSSIFAVCTVISLVVMYDAAGVRRAAGIQASVINRIVENIENQGLELDKKLKEILGHSPTEVFAGALLGIGIGIVSARVMELI